MMAKTGDNWHVHIAVSRRDATNSFNLSPNANGRGSKKHVLNGRKVRIGFNREAYKVECEHIFDKTFVHSRLQTESYERAKQLRKQSAYAYERQLMKDRAFRRPSPVTLCRAVYRRRRLRPAALFLFARGREGLLRLLCRGVTR